MRVNEAIVDRLVANGIDTVFGIPGKQTLPLNQSIGERDEIRYVVARHETAVSHQAWGYAESSGRIAATCVVPGPGDMNAMNGLKNALNDCTPLIHFSIETEPELRGGDGIHETPPDTYDNVVKENILVKNPAAAAAEVERAIAIAETHPKGPVRVGVPKNYLSMDVELAEPGDYPREHVSVDEASIDAAADVLADAERPVIIAGGGVRPSRAADDLVSFAERIDAPVVATYKGKGVIPETHELSAGVLCGGASDDVLALIDDSDVALGVGTDFDAVTTRNWTVPVPETLVHVTMNPDDLGTGYEPAVGILADAGDVLTALSDRLPERDRDGVDTGAHRARTVRETDAERMAPLFEGDGPLTSVAALDAVRRGTPEETIVTADAGGSRLWTLVSFPAMGPRKYVNPGSWATMGSGLPSAIGAACANPGESVLTIAGDGGLMMCIHELHTAAIEELPVTTVVFNNADYAIISEEAARSYPLPEGAYDWANAPLSFIDIAAGMGVSAERVETADEIERAVAEALESNEPRLVEVPTDPREPQAGVWMRDD